MTRIQQPARRAAVVALLLLVAASLVAGACGGGDKVPSGVQATVTPTVAGKPVSPGDFAVVSEAWKRVTSYRMAAHSEDPLDPSRTFTMTLETVLPDRQRIVIGDAYEAIIIKDTMYLKTGSTWMKSAVDEDMVGSMMPYNLADALDQASSDGVRAGKTGSETLDGVACDVWSIAMGQSTMTLWVATSDHLPRKLLISDAATETTVLEATISDYNAGISIDVPE